ncbi:Hypothetical protein D9617_3g018910 [Elsinoe fawcettii]|nr:Hypothetical protein D9617_3g018910 [Elsinoe fawcettii]
MLAESPDSPTKRTPSKVPASETREGVHHHARGRRSERVFAEAGAQNVLYPHNVSPDDPTRYVPTSMPTNINKPALLAKQIAETHCERSPGSPSPSPTGFSRPLPLSPQDKSDPATRQELKAQGVGVHDFVLESANEGQVTHRSATKAIGPQFAAMRWTESSEESAIEDSPPSPSSPGTLLPPTRYEPPKMPNAAVARVPSHSATSDGAGHLPETANRRLDDDAPKDSENDSNTLQLPEGIVEFGKSVTTTHSFSPADAEQPKIPSSPRFSSSKLEHEAGANEDDTSSRMSLTPLIGSSVVKAGMKRSIGNTCEEILDVPKSEHIGLPSGELDALALDNAPIRRSLISSLIPSPFRLRSRPVSLDLGAVEMQNLSRNRVLGRRITSQQPGVDGLAKKGNVDDHTPSRQSNSVDVEGLEDEKARRGTMDSDFWRNARQNREAFLSGSILETDQGTSRSNTNDRTNIVATIEDQRSKQAPRLSIVTHSIR